MKTNFRSSSKFPIDANFKSSPCLTVPVNIDEHDYLKFKLDNGVGRYIEVDTQSKADYVILNLFSSSDILLSSIEFNVAVARAASCSLDLPKKQILITANDGTEITCDITALIDFIDTKVDKEAGKGLVDNLEIARLSGVYNYDDTAINQKIDTHINDSDRHTSESDKIILDSFIAGNTDTATQTLNIGTAATAADYSKTINLGSGGAVDSVTNINIGSASGGTTAIESPNVLITGNLAAGAVETSTYFVLSTAVDENNNPIGTFDPALRVLRGSSASAELLWKETDKSWKVKEVVSGQQEKKIMIELDTLDGGTW